MSGSPRAIELYAGIGGFAAAVQGHAEVVAAYDHKVLVQEVYRANWGDHIRPQNLQYLPVEALARFEADLWWMSPPCQPYTRRGNQKDLDDPRAASFVRLVEALGDPSIRPKHFALENVVGFEGSRGHGFLRETLQGNGFNVFERELCPTELGIPARRPRYYLIASQDELAPVPLPDLSAPLAAYLDSESQEWLVREERVLRFERSMHLLEPTNPNAVAATFTSAYGKSPVAAGSYIQTELGPRFVSPREMLRTLHFPEEFVLPSEASQAVVEDDRQQPQRRVRPSHAPLNPCVERSVASEAER